MELTVNVDGMTGRVSSEGGMVNFNNDTQANVQFYKRPVVNKRLSLEHGYPYSENVDFVRIQHPGEKDFIDRPVSDDTSVIQRFSHQWQQFQRNADAAQANEGVPIDLLFPMSPDIGANLRAVGVFTIEQLAGVSAHGLSSLGLNGQLMVTKAQQYLASAKNGAPVHELEKKLADSNNTIGVLQNQIAMLQESMNRLQSQQAGVPATMMPPQRHSIGQTLAIPQIDSAAAPMQQARFIPDQPMPKPLNIADWNGAPDSQEADASSEQPKRGGWPKGKPRNAA